MWDFWFANRVQHFRKNLFFNNIQRNECLVKNISFRYWLRDWFYRKLVDFLRKVGEPLSGKSLCRKLPVRRDENCQETFPQRSRQHCRPLNGVWSTQVRVRVCVSECVTESVTVRGVDTHLRNWPNATHDNVLCVWITGRGARTWHFITWPGWQTKNRGTWARNKSINTRDEVFKSVSYCTYRGRR